MRHLPIKAAIYGVLIALVSEFAAVPPASAIERIETQKSDSLLARIRSLSAQAT